MHNHDDMQIHVYEDRPDKEREAYAYWSGEANGNVTKVARDLEIPVRTVFSWQSRYHWKAERTRSLRDITEAAADEGRLLLSQAVRAAASRLVKMFNDDEASHLDQRENMRVLFDLIYEGKAPETTNLIDARQVHITAQDADPLRTATAALSANVAQVGNETRRGKRKTF